MDEKNKVILILCYGFKPWEPHTFMYVMCIEMLPRYVMLVRTHIFDIYVHHDIMQALPVHGVR